MKGFNDARFGLGHGKTGKLVAEVAAEHGHGVHVLDAKENPAAAALTPPFVAGFDVVIDFTTPEAAVQNMRACLATGAKMVIGTTGWYDKLARCAGWRSGKAAGLLYGTNFSVGVQVMLKLAGRWASALKDAGIRSQISETHHASKLDAPSGRRSAWADGGIAPGWARFRSRRNREGDETGLHVLTATSESDRITLRHESFSRRAFAEGAVRAAEWLSTGTGCYDFQDVFGQM